MRAMLVPVGMEPREIELSDEDTLHDLQERVGGWIDVARWVFDDAPTVYVNDEGKFTCEPNRAIYATEKEAGCIGFDGEVHEGDLLDIIFGDFVCVGFDPETGEDRDISDEEVKRVMERFGGAQSRLSGCLEAMIIRSKR